VRTRGAWALPQPTRGTWALPMGWAHPLSTRGAWTALGWGQVALRSWLMIQGKWVWLHGLKINRYSIRTQFYWILH